MKKIEPMKIGSSLPDYYPKVRELIFTVNSLIVEVEAQAKSIEWVSGLARHADGVGARLEREVDEIKKRAEEIHGDCMYWVGKHKHEPTPDVREKVASYINRLFPDKVPSRALHIADEILAIVKEQP